MINLKFTNDFLTCHLPIKIGDLNFDAIMDTGFSGDLYINKSHKKLFEKLIKVGIKSVKFGNGEVQKLELAQGVIQIKEEYYVVDIIFSNADHTLIGMGFLENRRLNINMIKKIAFISES